MIIVRENSEVVIIYPDLCIYIFILFLFIYIYIWLTNTAGSKFSSWPITSIEKDGGCWFLVKPRDGWPKLTKNMGSVAERKKNHWTLHCIFI